MNKVAFITGHLDVTEEEFNQYYRRSIDKYFSEGYRFVVGDARGCDTITQEYLSSIKAECLVYHMFDGPRNNPLNYPTSGGFSSDEERDAEMHKASSVTIAWVRTGREKSGTAKNLKRRAISD